MKHFIRSIKMIWITMSISILCVSLLRLSQLDSNYDISELNSIMMYGMVIISLLLCLLRDNNSDVKNWAAFSINFNQYDTEDIREEFVGMLLDTNDDIRIEVISGLAERKDERVLETIIKELKKDVIFDEIIIAAGNAGSKELLPILNELLNEFRDERIIDKINESIKKIKENVCE